METDAEKKAGPGGGQVDAVVIQHWEDLEFTVVATPHEYHVDYVLYEIAGYTEPGNKPLWPKKGADPGPDFVESLDDAEPYLHGHVKWDGCSNWSFDEQDRGVMLHGCSRDDLLHLGEVMARCWDLTKGLCPNWSDA